MNYNDFYTNEILTEDYNDAYRNNVSFKSPKYSINTNFSYLDFIEDIYQYNNNYIVVE